MVVAAAGVLSFEALSGSPGTSSHRQLAASHRAHADPPVTATTAPSSPAPPPIPPQPASTLVAATHGAIPGYATAGAPAPDMTVPGSWFGYPSVLPVIATEPGWLEVRLAQRPNGSTIWVQQSDVTLSTTPYALVVDLAT